MGLDMYLTGIKFIWEEEEGKKIGEVVSCPFSKSVKRVSVEAMYWRKANEIHGWFVENVQGGTDDCGDYYVSLDKLTELMNLCKKVLDVAKIGHGEVRNGQCWKNGEWSDIIEEGITILNQEEVSDILATKSGFFFGSTDYDQYYLTDIRYTYERIKEILSIDKKELRRWDFYYNSSW